MGDNFAGATGKKPLSSAKPVDHQRRHGFGSIPPAMCSARRRSPSRRGGHAHRRGRATTSAAPTPPAPPFEPVPCDVFITEATFGLPVFRPSRPAEEIAKPAACARAFPERCASGRRLRLGKAQRVIALLRAGRLRRADLHPRRAEKLCAYYESRGIGLGPLEPATIDNRAKDQFAGKIVLGPPSAFADKWARRFPDPVIAFRFGLDARAPARQTARRRAAADPVGPFATGTS
jgi:putative mRNA 3-end processing factor